MSFKYIREGFVSTIRPRLVSRAIVDAVIFYFLLASLYSLAVQIRDGTFRIPLVSRAYLKGYLVLRSPTNTTPNLILRNTAYQGI